MTRQEIEKIKTQYSPGTKLRLLHMQDPRPLPTNSILTVTFIDDAGLIHVVESGIALIPSVDEISYVCSVCGAVFDYPPAQSCIDRKNVCRKCSASEALDAAGITDQTEILNMIR